MTTLILKFRYEPKDSNMNLKNKQNTHFFVGPLSRVRPRNGILALGLVVLVVLIVLVLVLPLRSEFIGEL